MKELTLHTNTNTVEVKSGDYHIATIEYGMKNVTVFCIYQQYPTSFQSSEEAINHIKEQHERFIRFHD